MYTAYELADTGVTGNVQSFAKAHFLELDLLWWEEVIDGILDNQLIVSISLCSTVSSNLLKKLEGLSEHEIMGHPVLLGYHRKILSLDDIFQNRD